MMNFPKILTLAAILLLLPSVQAVSYLHANGLVAKLEGEQLEFYHSDYLGSTRTISNEAAQVIEEQKTLPFGGVLEGDEKYGFTGKELDESGLQYFGARYYDSELGRFLSADKVELYPNLYSYARNNPLKYNDPTGNSPALALVWGSTLIAALFIPPPVKLPDQEGFPDAPEMGPLRGYAETAMGLLSLVYPGIAPIFKDQGYQSTGPGMDSFETLPTKGMPMSFLIKKPVPNNMGEYMGENGISLATLARKVGTSPYLVQGYMHGEHIPSAVTALRIAASLGKPVEEVFPPYEEGEDYWLEPFEEIYLDGTVGLKAIREEYIKHRRSVGGGPLWVYKHGNSKLGLSQEDIGFMVGCGQRTICDIEAGSHQTSIQTIVRLAHLFNTDTKTILGIE